MLSECCIFRIFHVQYHSGHCLAFCVFLYKRIELPHREQIHGSGLLACRACMLFSPFKLYLSLFKKDKEPPFRKHLCIRGALSLKIGSHHIKLFTFFSSAIQLIEGLN